MGGGGAGALTINEPRALIGSPGGAGRRLDMPSRLPVGGLRAASRGSGVRARRRGRGLRTSWVYAPGREAPGPGIPPPSPAPALAGEQVRAGCVERGPDSARGFPSARRGGRRRTCRWSAGRGRRGLRPRRLVAVLPQVNTP